MQTDPRGPGRDDIETVFNSATSATGAVELVVTIPTFKRPEHLILTLKSVLNQSTKRPYAIVVMDNHAEAGEGAKVAAALLQQQNIPAVVILAHRRGNCAAYNAGFHTALEQFPEAQWVQVIDDDEIASPSWLDTMVAVAADNNADFVGAPQHPIFQDGGDQAWAQHPVFRPPYRESGPVPILYSSGNVLIRTALLRRHGYPWLDERFNFLGGGDSDFYSRCRESGASFAWAHRAGVDETTPRRRTELSWLNSRSLRNGSISALIQRKAANSASDHAKRLVKSLVLLAASPYRSLTLFVKTRSATMALNPMNVAVGRLLMEFGFANEQYRDAEKN